MGLIWTYFQFKAFQTIEFFKVFFRYYRYPKFALADLTFHLLYLFQNPFRISKKFLKKKGAENIHIYGETPLTTLDPIFENLNPGDVVFELGSGRGRSALFLSLARGAEVFAVEQIPKFSKKLSFLKKLFRIKNLHPSKEDLFQIDLSKADWVYLYASDFTDEQIRAFQSMCQNMKKGAQVITVSFPLKSPDWVLIETKKGVFPWGKATVYIQTMISKNHS